jgi:hypothetical protein
MTEPIPFQDRIICHSPYDDPRAIAAQSYANQCDRISERIESRLIHLAETLNAEPDQSPQCEIDFDVSVRTRETCNVIVTLEFANLDTDNLVEQLRAAVIRQGERIGGGS